tara:strand:- start:15 stop:209 length:195 start_codon:yes stop_codon:yes gene_type:complete
MKPGDLVRITNEKTTHKMPRVSLALVECWNSADEESEGHWVFKDPVAGNLFTAEDAIDIEIVEL